MRKGEVERLFEAGSRSVSIRVIKDKRTAVCNTSDLAPTAIDEMVRTAIDLARISEPDEFAGLPDREDLATEMGAQLQMYDERIETLTVDEMKDIVAARRAGGIRLRQARHELGGRGVRRRPR